MYRASDQYEAAYPAPPQAAPLRAVPVSVPKQGRFSRIHARCTRLDLAIDLAEGIGSPRWFRGLGTLFVLGCAALAFWPDFTALEAATTSVADVDTRDEARSLAIMPLHQGGESGRRMAANPSLVAALANVPERPRIELVATLGEGDSFALMLQRAGVGPGDAGRAAAIVAQAVAPGSIAPGTRIAVVLGQRPAIGEARTLEKLDFRATFDLALAVERRGGALGLLKRPIAVDETPLRISGTVGDSVYRSARAAGAPVEAIQEYLRTLDANLGIEGQVEPGDQFDMVVGFRRSVGGESQVGRLLYAGLERGGKAKAQLVRQGNDGAFVDAAAGVTRQVGGMFAPVAGRMTSGFGMRRHPILGYARMHSGVDYGAAWGSPIFAVNDGLVGYAGWHGGHGKYVRLDHGGGLGTGYAHMSRIAVEPGMRVRGGQIIGYVGSSGLSTGPHLHYEVYRGGQKVNPMGASFAVRSEVDQSQLAALKAQVAKMKALAPRKALGRPGPVK